MDTVRLNALDKICGLYYAVMPDSVIAYSHLAYDFSKKTGHKRGMSQALMIRGATYGLKGDYQKSLYCNQQVLKLNREMNYESGINKCYINIGTCYEHLGDEATAIKYYYQALAGFAKIKESRPALVRSNKECMALALSNLAGVYRHVGQTDSALALIKKSLAMHTEMKNTARMVKTLNTMGTIYYGAYNPDSAIVCHEKAIELCTDPTLQWDLANSYTYLAQACLEKKKYPRAKEAALKSLEIGRQLKDSLSIGFTLNILSNIVHDMGDLKKALALGQESFEILRKKSVLAVSVNQAVTMAMWYSEHKDLKKAGEMYDFYFRNRDVTNTKDIKEELFRSQVKYDFEKKQLLAKAELDKKINDLRFEAEQKDARKNTWLIIISFLFVLCVLSAWFIYNNLKQKSVIALQKNNILKQQLLVSQMNPHFIFNSLTAVQNFIFKQDSYHAGIYLKKFSELIRMILDFSRKDLISLDDECTFLENYLELQKLRFNNKLNYDIKIDPELEKDMVMIPPMLAQPFIENAIEHGIFYKNGEGFLSVKISLNKNTLLFEIEDDGIGLGESLKLKNESGKKHQSLAIQITKERIETMNTQNKTAFEIEIKDKALLKKESSGVYVRFATPYLTL